MMLNQIIRLDECWQCCCLIALSVFSRVWFSEGYKNFVFILVEIAQSLIWKFCDSCNNGKIKRCLHIFGFMFIFLSNLQMWLRWKWRIPEFNLVSAERTQRRIFNAAAKTFAFSVSISQRQLLLLCCERERESMCVRALENNNFSFYSEHGKIPAAESFMGLHQQRQQLQ